MAKRAEAQLRQNKDATDAYIRQVAASRRRLFQFQQNSRA